jgi:hypothetical protein
MLVLGVVESQLESMPQTERYPEMGIVIGKRNHSWTNSVRVGRMWMEVANMFGLERSRPYDAGGRGWTALEEDG